jgi:hypothetical protein
MEPKKLVEYAVFVGLVVGVVLASRVTGRATRR